MPTPFDPAFTQIVRRISKLGYKVVGGQSHDRIVVSATSPIGEQFTVVYHDGIDSESAKRAARELAAKVGLVLDDH